MNKMKGVALVDEFDLWEEEILRRIQMEEQMKKENAKINSEGIKEKDEQ